MRPELEPEILRVDLCDALLQLLAWGEELASVEWLTPPGEAAGPRSLELLRLLGAADDRGRITGQGRLMASLPLHPRLARLLLEGQRRGQLRRAALLAATLSERSPFRSALGQAGADRRVSCRSDPLLRLSVVEGAAAQLPPSLQESIDHAGVGHVRRTGAHYERAARRVLRGQEVKAEPASADTDEPLLHALFVAFSDRLARLRPQGGGRGVMVGGRGVRLTPASGVTGSELFVCVEVDGGPRGERSEALVHQASEVLREWLPAQALRQERDHRFDEASERVVATERLDYHGLVIEERPCRPDPQVAARLLAERAAGDPIRALGLDRKPVRALLDRIAFLRSAMPELGLPDVETMLLGDQLAGLCQGRTSLAQLRELPLQDILRGWLSYAQQRTLDKEAPERIALPSGSRIELRYGGGAGPVLAVRIQELFGLQATPRIAGDRVPVMLHLLAPNMRPQQVTDDLASFWRNAYPEVRKELRARYPKHSWPADPLAAPAERRPRRPR